MILAAVFEDAGDGTKVEVVHPTVGDAAVDMCSAHVELVSFVTDACGHEDDDGGDRGGLRGCSCPRRSQMSREFSLGLGYRLSGRANNNAWVPNPAILSLPVRGVQCCQAMVYRQAARVYVHRDRWYDHPWVSTLWLISNAG